jgi:endonuclease YncB( thermonuclease family)
MGRLNPKVAARRRRNRLRTLALILVFLGLGALFDPAILAPIGPLAARPERIDATFTRCGVGRPSPGCVIDGDTFRLGDRRVRLVGIDAPELAEPRCAAERALAERSADRLTAMLNEAPFELIAHRFHGRDRFGRDLRLIVRPGQSIGDRLTAEGLAHRYYGMKRRWC